MRAGLSGTPIVEAPSTPAQGLADSIALDELGPRLASATELGEQLAAWMSSPTRTRIAEALRCNYACPVGPTPEEALAALLALLARSVHLDPARRAPVEVLLQLGDEGARAAALLRSHLRSGAVATHAATDAVVALATDGVILADRAGLASAVAPRRLDPVAPTPSTASPMTMTGLVGAALAGDPDIDRLLARAERAAFTAKGTSFDRRFAAVAMDFPASPEGRAAALIDLLSLYRVPRRPSHLQLDELRRDLGPSVEPVLDALVAVAVAREPNAQAPFHRDVVRVFAKQVRHADEFVSFLRTVGAHNDVDLAPRVRGAVAAPTKPAPTTASAAPTPVTPTTAGTARGGLDVATAKAATPSAAMLRAIGGATARPSSSAVNGPTLRAMASALGMGGGRALALVEQALATPGSKLGSLLGRGVYSLPTTPEGRAAALLRLLWCYREPGDGTKVRWAELRKDTGVEGQALLDALAAAQARTPSTRPNYRFLSGTLEHLGLLAPVEARDIAGVFVRASGLIPTSIPALDAVRADTPAGALAGKGLCAVQHLFPTLVPLIEACIARGMAPGDIHILGTPYATNPLVASYLRLLGVHVTEARDFGGATRDFEQVRVQEIGAFLGSVVHSGSQPPNGWKILDDGGLLQGTIAGHEHIDGVGLDATDLARAFPPDRCEAVEQTTRGLTELAKHPMVYPTVAVARSPGKREEGGIIGWSLADALLHELRQTGRIDDVHDVTLVSAGTVGMATAHHLKDAGFTVTLVDVDPQKRAAAKDAGFAVAARVEDTVANADLVFSCTGKTALDGRALKDWHGVIASGSSAAIEFNRDQINALRAAPIAELNRGRPLNFNGDGYENLSKEQIGITRALLFCALTQETGRTPGLVDLDEDRDALAVRVWRQHGGDDTAALTRGTPRSTGGTRPDIGDIPARHDEWMAFLSSLPAAVCPPPSHTGFVPGVYFFADGDRVRVVDTREATSRSRPVDLPSVPRRAVAGGDARPHHVVELHDGSATRLAVVDLAPDDTHVTTGPVVHRLLAVDVVRDPRFDPSWGPRDARSVLYAAGDVFVFSFEGCASLHTHPRAFGDDALVYRAPQHTVVEINRSPPAIAVHALLAGDATVARHARQLRVPPAFVRVDALAPLDDHGNFALVGVDASGATLIAPLAVGPQGEKVTRLPPGAVFRGMHRPEPDARPFWFAVDYSLPGDPVELEHFRQVQFSMDWGGV